jgi:hypothetical protein
MHQPNRSAPQSEWLAWADSEYPFSGYEPRRRGFEVLRGIEDPQLRSDVLWAIVKAMGPDVSPPVGFKPGPDPRLPPERDDDASGVDEI